MKSNAAWALVVVNVLLLGNLCFRGLTRSADAQAVRASDYIMIPADVVGGNNSVIYIVDTRQGLLSARTIDQQGKQLVDMGAPIDLNRVLGARR